MKKRTFGLAASLGALTLVWAGAAYAEPSAKRGADADGNGVVTRAEAQTQASALFARLDFNKDGQLNPADRAARRDQRRAEMFGKLDTDGNGQISKSEFAAPRPGKPHAGKTEARPGLGKHHFGGPDGHRGHRGWGGHGRGGMMMKSADSDNNGAISQAEFTTAAMARFDRADANKDGQVTREERQAAKAQMRDQMRQKWRETKSPSAPVMPAS